mmetsp:Transcript_19865/g.27365  ORF Transcript_19865/g.27365 Transcript_19865/m.27365 type:complete len:109 (-) Transcript_19865:9-335(-)
MHISCFSSPLFLGGNVLEWTSKFQSSSSQSVSSVHSIGESSERGSPVKKEEYGEEGEECGSFFPLSGERGGAQRDDIAGLGVVLFDLMTNCEGGVDNSGDESGDESGD